MEFSAILMAMIKLFPILAVGYCCQKLWVFPDGTQDVLTKLVLYVTTPCTILSSVLSGSAPPSLRAIGVLFAISFLSYALLIPVALLVPWALRVAPGQRGAWACMLIFSNSGFIGYPVVETIFGSDAVFHAALFNLPFYLFIYTVGVVLLSRGGARRGAALARKKLTVSTFLSPCVAASLLAILLAVTGLGPEVPAVISDTVGMLGDITTPAALLVIGIFIARMPLRAMLGTPKLYILSAVRLLGLPALIYLVFGLFVSDPLVLGIAMVITAMPSATIVAMLSLEYGADTETVTQGTFLTTVLSIVTIPLLVSILM